MKLVVFLNKSFFVFIVSILSVSCAARDIEFSVTPSRDRMEVDSVFSKNSAYFTSKGSSQVGIYSRNPYKRTGSICCHKGEKTEEFFLKDREGNDLLMQLKQGEGHSDAVRMLSVFDTEGKLMAGPLNLKNSQSQLIAVSPSKEKFAVLDRGNIIVYSSNLKIIKEYSVSKELSNIDAIALSNDANSVLVKNSKSLFYVDLQLSREAGVAFCSVTETPEFKIAAFDAASSNSFFFVSQAGSACVINAGEAKIFKASFTDKLLAAYATNENLHVLTSDTITTFNSTSFANIGLFELTPYYEDKFGKDSSVRPLFLKSEFDPQSNTFFLRDGGNSGTFFEIQQIKD
ncbi:hypothetical protein [Marinagarivorans algicola]|uniref:hypothetical protein n=1 Tax=Marinagarivorans algicola TaxID=1513270 RepID=UPI0006B995C8|nr:hypothetical protein [Marinagarivorans algicola]